eukprot:CAMPEP_0176250432 /NCGR_PEP_ID=MMETSP0121_2-20121125/34482_1 /TAXON_ID=160619 /ORGANISM="Kryptoperidinium foliaceum, Strain CCMP 1326" /LENGTH=86 /DNA_ID=CAMNT_0017590147 /DNA_START=97 /DNA_END=357 /DNA_ORIENTATION=-
MRSVRPRTGSFKSARALRVSRQPPRRVRPEAVLAGAQALTDRGFQRAIALRSRASFSRGGGSQMPRAEVGGASYRSRTSPSPQPEA